MNPPTVISRPLAFYRRLAVPMRRASFRASWYPKRVNRKSQTSTMWWCAKTSSRKLRLDRSKLRVIDPAEGNRIDYYMGLINNLFVKAN